MAGGEEIIQEQQVEGASPEQIANFMNGKTLAEYQAVVTEVQSGVEDMTRLARSIEDSTDEKLAAVLKDVLAENPEVIGFPAVKKLEAKRRPKHLHTPLLDACIEADVPAYLYGEAGSGKSTAAENAAAVRGLNFRAISLSPQTSKSDLLGYRDANGEYNTTGNREIYEFGGIYLYDEIDNGNPAIIALMNRGLSGWEMEFPDKSVERHWHTRIIAAANTIGKGATAQYVGRNALDAATLDRFAMIPWDIDPHLEAEIVKVKVAEKPEPLDISEGGVPSREEWLDETRGYRERAQDKGLRVVISPRSAIYGAKLAEVGVGVHWLAEMLIYKGIPESDRRKLGH